MAVEVADVVHAEPTGVDIVWEQEHRRRADVSGPAEKWRRFAVIDASMVA
jgi:type IV secretory pathway TrbF-like protein